MSCTIPAGGVGLKFDHRFHELFAIVEVAGQKRPASLTRALQQGVDKLLVLVYQLLRLLLLAVDD